ncbi:MAG: aquaporin family protein [Flavobacteriales bacterium]|jgi:glycerol uptake facilitator protein|uniref:MIP/aquaporin family protein n=1 Tax=Blattabacterium sp. (Mastotermes darwiniensis) TaxID=39768 RepID=UPI000231DDC0|nr:MIP/aquaporin family protein [Blattabacterium sp. (Mastotermes darwiniensis)]AER40500.1 putative glycerol diffusion channel [Blattabacterium sp. (Mastotermes darwiniensis) str. MADAR]MDR1804985.1 aquaporin family protein [Flavobacteriales bacterium]
MIKFYAEIIGTMILVFLGNGVGANVLLSKTKGHKDGGWLTITIGWALAVFMGIIVSFPYSGAHLNPSVTIGLAIVGKFNWGLVPFYILSQFIGSMLGALLVWILYKDHFLITENEKYKLSVFATCPSIRNFTSNFLSEVLATFIFMFLNFNLTEGSIFFHEKKYSIAFPLSLIVLGIGLSLGGTTGYAINPARDLGPRIIYSLIKIPGKGKSNWDYAWIPVLGPVIGSSIASILYLLFSK